ncbi:MAG: type II toxin-antitoxin system RelB/DinJ family antitoxin [Treponema sp.]|jgi:DNA-damage-inducible protein J|nr:type II toxin-antitoxin system RelB/DinJ family antitoxin [Treponema sp.]
MPKANINIKIDTAVKEQAAQLLERMGIDQTTAIDMFFRQIIAEQRLPFQPVVNLTPDERIITAALQRNPQKVELTADADGNILVDKEKNPEVYDWAVNG